MINFLFEKNQKILNDIRTFFYAKVFGSFGRESKVLGRIKCYHPKNIFVGRRTTINEAVILNARARLRIGDYVHISPGCIINTGSLDYNKKMAERGHVACEIIIEDGVWLGSGSIINPGVRVGKNSVVGAGAVVTKDVPENVVVVGVPAKVIKSI